MLLINKLTLSTSTFTVSTNKRKRTPSMASITPLLQRIKRSFLQTKPPSTSTTPSPRRSNTVHCCRSEKKRSDDGTSCLL